MSTPNDANASAQPYNRPGLPALTYRIGDYAAFRQRLLARLPLALSPENDPNQGGPLAKLTTRASDDPAIALLDAWAVVADVLTFYQERIANEGYLRTATERRSVLELARAIGYELNPGVAASTVLAFTVDESPGTAGVATVPQGTQVVSIPGQDELPQTFETRDEIVARAEWNALKPRPTRPQTINQHSQSLYLQGLTSQLQPGSQILLVGEGSPPAEHLLTLTTVQPIPQAGHTLVAWEQLALPPIEATLQNPKVFAFRQRVSLFGSSAPRWQTMPVELQRAAVLAAQSTIPGGVFASTNNGSWSSVSTGLPSTDILCLTLDPATGYLFVGTPGNGIFRSTDRGTTWTAINTGLANLSIQTLTCLDKMLLAGTPGGGVFRSKDNGDTWAAIGIGSVRVKSNPEQPNRWGSINTGLPNTVVRALSTHVLPGRLGQGTVSGDGMPLRGENTDFQQQLLLGDAIIIERQTRIVTAIGPDQTIEIDVPFATPLVSKNLSIDSRTYIFAGTDDGVYCSLDQGKNWQLKGLPSKAIRSLLVTTTRLMSGKITSCGTQVLGKGTSFKKNLRRGDVIVVSNQKRTVAEIISDTELQLDLAFTPNLSEASQFSSGKEITYIFAGTDDSIHCSEDLGESWSPKSPSGNKTVHTLLAYEDAGSHYVLAGTNQGFYRSKDQGEHWQHSNLSEEHRASAIRSLAFDKRETGPVIYAGTDSGVFSSSDRGVNWRLCQNQPTAIEITALAVNKNGEVFAGTRFVNFTAESSQAAASRNSPVYTDWPNFQVETQAVDLDSLYPQILAGSRFVLLVSEPESKLAARKVSDLSTVLRRDFALEAKVTRLVPNSAIQANSFGLRDTIALIQSEPLQLAEEPLTVTVQQGQIFSDPIVSNKILLSQFVAGLQAGQMLIVSGKRIRATINTIGGVFHLPQRSATWQRKSQGLTDSRIQALALHPNNPNSDLFAGTPSGVFVRQQNSEAWQAINEGLTSLEVQAIAIHPDGSVFVGTNNGVFCLPNERKLWVPINTGLVHPQVRTLAIQQNGNLFAGTKDGGVFLLVNGGQTWSQTGLTNTDIQVLAIGPNGNSSIFAGSLDGAVFCSKDNGNSWQNLSQGLPNTSITAIVAYQDQQSHEQVLIGTADSGVFRLNRSSDTGPWEPFNINLTDMKIRCLAVNSTSEVEQIFAGSASGTVFRSDSLAPGWEAVQVSLINTEIRALIVGPSNQIWAGGPGILLSPEGFAAVELRQGDQVQVMAPPTLAVNVPEMNATETNETIANSATAQNWTLLDKNGFIGHLTTLQPSDISLQPALADDPMISEISVVANPPEDQQKPILVLQAPLQNSYDPTTTTLCANAVHATHGETVLEALGSGDGNEANMQFILKKPPLTYVSAPTASGAESTLNVHVNGVLWQNVPSLAELAALDHSYITRIDDDGTTTLTFGDGERGARLPTGQENLTASYRSGLGPAGEVAAGSLSLLKTRPLGILEVTNPLPALGAAAPETQNEARAKAPASVRTLDRIVSLRDFEDFALAFAGIGKAQVAALWNGESQLAQLTVAARGGGPVPQGSRLYENLVQAIDAARDPVQLAQVDSYEQLLFNLEAKVLVDSRYPMDAVLAQINTALRETFSFEKRQFGQDVTTSEVIAAIQAIAGVVAVDLDALYRLGFSKTLEKVLPASPARWNASNRQVQPAQLLLLNAAGVTLSAELTP
ncbi:putative baseplate assembly protein [Leptolyngbya sp. FACHB-261]|uniref:putative baseplate assembly protein n=1 Tax=Leptolyngbya sp. FACHB-261 TaxID=2692806 RepID=UPI0016887A55|nr:putative baseplate assembly protein [Leptolyngbya sp. FACHB-261]MBD2099870.1 putative baseplate assembly protein [Leptolyngbya sp. FACHB-261]